MSEHVFANIINVKHHYSDQSLPCAALQRGWKIEYLAWSVLWGRFLSKPGHDFYIVYYLEDLLQCVDGPVKDIKTMI